MTNASDMYKVKLDDSDWYELIMKDECPIPRAYSASFVYKKNLYVFGGCDLDQGYLNCFWSLELKTIEQFYLDFT